LLLFPGQDDNHRLSFIHLGGERHCERKLAFPRRHDNTLVTRSARSGVQAATVLCARQLPVLYRMSAPFPSRIKKLKKSKKVTADVSDSIFQVFGIVIPIASISIQG